MELVVGWGSKRRLTKVRRQGDWASPSPKQQRSGGQASGWLLVARVVSGEWV